MPNKELSKLGFREEIIEIETPSYPKELAEEWKTKTHQEKIKFFFRWSDSFPAASQINAKILVQELKREKQNELFNKIIEGIENFVCPDCGQSEKIGCAFTSYPKKQLLFFCAICSGCEIIWDSELPEYKAIWGGLRR